MIFGHQALNDLQICESTQDEMLLHLDSVPTNTAKVFWVRSESQIRGRGRQNTPWINTSPQDQLLCSAGIKHEFAKKIGPMMSLFAGNILYKSLIHLDAQLKDKIYIKWPNDLYANTKSTPTKLAGILCEQKKQECTLVGFGINVLSSPNISQKSTNHLSAFTLIAEKDSLRDMIYASLMATFTDELNGLTKNSDVYRTNLIKDLQQNAMKPFLELQQIMVMGRVIKPVKLNQDGTLDALEWPGLTPFTLA